MLFINKIKKKEISGIISIVKTCLKLYAPIYFLNFNRFKHMNLRSNTESIAFYDSSESELWNINQHFYSLLSTYEI